MPPDQPTDAGKDRETIKRILRERYEDLAFSPGDAYTRVVDAIAQALAAARREGQAQERQLLKDALMYLGSARQMLADTDMPGTPWWDGLTKMIAAIRACGEEPSR